MQSTSFIRNRPINALNTYNPSGVSFFGNVYQKTIDSQTCFGPANAQFYSVQDDFAGVGGFTSSGVGFASDNNRFFVLSTVAAGVINVAGYEINSQTKLRTLLGRIQVLLPNAPATTHTPMSLRVIDNGTTGWQFFFATRPTGTNATRNGGEFLINLVDRSDFSMSVTPTIFYPAQTSNAKACYFLQDPTLLGNLHQMGTTPTAGIMGTVLRASSSEIITFRGVAGTLLTDGFFYNVTPTIVSNVSTAPVVNGTASVFQMTGHPFQDNDALYITANAPTGFNVALPNTNPTPYFVRNRTANTFELSATFGGTSILGTSVTTPTFIRAFGISSNNYNSARKSGTVTTGFAGTALLLDCIKLDTIPDGPVSIQGQECIFLPTTSNFYAFRVSDISSGVTSFPNSSGINALGNTTDFVGLGANVAATYSGTLGKVIFSTAAFNLFMKSWLNNNISHAFGSQDSTYYELISNPQSYFRGFVVNGMDVKNGVLFISITATIGQRGILVVDLRSDASFDFSKVISPVTYIGPSKGNYITTLEKLYDITDSLNLRIRSAQTETDAIFSDQTSGWVTVETLDDLSSLNFGPWAQIECKFVIASRLSGNPAQIFDLILGHTDLTMSDPEFFGMVDGSTVNSPSKTVYIQTRLLANWPVTLYHRGYNNDDLTLVETLDTVNNLANFRYSTDNGLTWTAGIGPNQVGKRIEVTRTSPAGMVVRNSLKAS